MILHTPVVNGGTMYQTTTDAEGHFSITTLPAGTYQVQVPNSFPEPIDVILSPDGRSYSTKVPEGYSPPAYTAGTDEELRIKVTPRPNLPFVPAARLP